MPDFMQAAKDPSQTLATFTFDELAQFKREKVFDPADSSDFRVFYVGRDDVHGVLKYLLSHCSRSLYMNMFGYDDDELDAIIQHLITSAHVFVQGTLDASQSSGVHEKKIIASWSGAVRGSFAIGESKTHQISHTKGGVLDGKVAFEGSTNWSASGEGTIVAADGSDTGRKAQNNTLTVYLNSVEVAVFTAELNEEHVVALSQKHATVEVRRGAPDPGGEPGPPIVADGR